MISQGPNSQVSDEHGTGNHDVVSLQPIYAALCHQNTLKLLRKYDPA